LEFVAKCQVRSRWTATSRWMSLSGELGGCDADELEALLRDVMQAAPARMTVDLSDLHFLGLRPALVLIDAERWFTAASSELVIGPVSRVAQRALTLARQHRAFVAVAA
jgi:anti-anti-sigma regulatory factor